MKFSRPINREVEIDGSTFVVSFDDNGIDFRLKGKRRQAHLDWVGALDAARGEQGAAAREFLGVGEAGSTGDDATGADERRQEIGRAVTAGEVGPES